MNSKLINPPKLLAIISTRKKMRQRFLSQPMLDAQLHQMLANLVGPLTHYRRSSIAPAATQVTWRQRRISVGVPSEFHLSSFRWRLFKGRTPEPIVSSSPIRCIHKLVSSTWRGSCHGRPLEACYGNLSAANFRSPTCSSKAALSNNRASTRVDGLGTEFHSNARKERSDGEGC